MGAIDLHTHSNVSDGILTPAELLREAARRGLRVLALTDHDTVAGLAEAAAEATAAGVKFIPGVELSTDVGRHEAHILGYYVDATRQEFVSELATLERQRLDRIERIVTKLGQIGMPVDLDRVFELAGPGTVGRPHVARAMIEEGYVNSVREAFNLFLTPGRPGYVTRQKKDPEDAVQLILQAGGVPVLAHPYSTGNIDAMLSRLIPLGLLGMEVFYGEYDRGQRDHLLAIARRRGLIATGGSDYHGEGFKEGRDLGEPVVPEETVELLQSARERVRSHLASAHVVA